MPIPNSNKSTTRPAKADMGMEAIKIWVLVDGNIVPVEIPVALRPFHVNNVQPRYANLERVLFSLIAIHFGHIFMILAGPRLLTVTGNFPPEVCKPPSREDNSNNFRCFMMPRLQCTFVYPCKATLPSLLM